MNCGTILEEGAIVSEVQFQERAGGHDVIGKVSQKTKYPSFNFCAIFLTVATACRTPDAHLAALFSFHSAISALVQANRKFNNLEIKSFSKCSLPIFDFLGQFISHDRAQQNGLVGVPGLNRTESREVTYQRGRKLIQEVCYFFIQIFFYLITLGRQSTSN